MNAPLLTEKEAAEFIAKCFTREYRIKCLAYLKEKHGDDYADAIKAMVVDKFEKRKKK